MLLTEEGYSVTYMSNPEDALKEVSKGHYHIAIVDIVMPHMNGIELIKQIKEIDADISPIILTGYPSIETAISAVKADACDYLKKPFQLVELLCAIKKVITRKGLLVSPEKMLLEKIGKKIREIRKKKNLSLKQLANRTHLSVSMISQMELADSAPSIATLYKVLMALNMTLGEFFKEL